MASSLEYSASISTVRDRGPRALCRHSPLLLLLTGYAAVVFLVAALYHRTLSDLSLATVTSLFTCLFALIALCLALLRAVRSDREHPYAAMAAWWRGWWPEHGPGVAVALVALPALMTIFFTGKLLITEIQPFAWDARLAELDRLLHGGAPWKLLQPVLGFPSVTYALSQVYSLWFLLMLGSWATWALVDHPQRLRFLISYMLCWILLGTFAATLFSSAGPLFYAEITRDPTVYGEQMAYLRAVDREASLFSLRIRDHLWQAYMANSGSGGSGISAMPSLHVAIVTLCAISSWYVTWRIGVAMTVYAVVICVGSVHLGWHYAVDGYVSIIAVTVIWYAVGRFLDRPEATGNQPSRPED